LPDRIVEYLNEHDLVSRRELYVKLDVKHVGRLESALETLLRRNNIVAVGSGNAVRYSKASLVVAQGRNRKAVIELLTKIHGSMTIFGGNPLLLDIIEDYKSDQLAKAKI
jgi:hypothetical protein